MKYRPNNILIAFDGSDQALNAVGYISRFLTPEKIEVTLFHVAAEIPETFLDLGDKAEFSARMAPIRAWVMQQNKEIKEAMGKAEKMLFDAGFKAKAVKTKSRIRKKGIARDILAESQEGYNALVMGRTGQSKIKDILMGSVADKLVGKVTQMPVIVVGGQPETQKVLLAFDGSEGAMKAVSFVGPFLANAQFQVCLCHVIRPLGIVQPGFGNLFLPEQEQAWIETNRQRIASNIESAKVQLINSGIKPEYISTKILTHKTSRAGGMIEEARAGGYGTIVTGRRGLSAVEEFFMGRVSRKILDLAENMAVWIVS